MFYGGKFSMEYISPKGQTFAMAIYSQMRKAPGIPPDYTSPLGIFGKALFWSPGFDYPQEIRNTVYVTTGKVIALNSAGKTRLNLSGGIGCSYLKTPVDFVPIEPVVTAENYTYSSSTGYSVAVSYTHLDVYKRQTLHHSSRFYNFIPYKPPQWKRKITCSGR